MDSNPADEFDALASRLGQRLGEARRAVHTTQCDLARRTYVDRSYVSHAEHGRFVPERKFWVLTDDHLGANGALIAAYDQFDTIRQARKQAELDALRGRHQVAVAAARTVVPPERDLTRFGRDPAGTTALLRDLVEATDVDRRHFLLLTGGALTGFAHDWLFDPATVGEALAGKRVGHTEVDGLNQIADIRRKLHDTVSARDLLPPAQTDLRLVVRILESATYSDEVGTRLYATAAEFARMAGILAFENGEHAAAQHYLLAGLRAAHLSGDRTLGANILVSLAAQANELDRPGDGVRLTESALMAAKELTPAVAARVNGHLAEASSRLGDTTTADRVIGRVFDLTAASDPVAEPSWIYWWSATHAEGFAGRVALMADRPQQAEQRFLSTVAGLDPATYPQDRAANLYRLATARLRLGEVEGACHTAAEAAAITRDLASERLRSQLRDFRRTAQPHASSVAVRNFDTHTADLLHIGG